MWGDVNRYVDADASIPTDVRRMLRVYFDAKGTLQWFHVSTLLQSQSSNDLYAAVKWVTEQEALTTDEQVLSALRAFLGDVYLHIASKRRQVSPEAMRVAHLIPWDDLPNQPNRNAKLINAMVANFLYVTVREEAYRMYVECVHAKMGGVGARPPAEILERRTQGGFGEAEDDACAAMAQNYLAKKRELYASQMREALGSLSIDDLQWIMDRGISGPLRSAVAAFLAQKGTLAYRGGASPDTSAVDSLNRILASREAEPVTASRRNTAANDYLAWFADRAVLADELVRRSGGNYMKLWNPSLVDVTIDQIAKDNKIKIPYPGPEPSIRNEKKHLEWEERQRAWKDQRDLIVGMAVHKLLKDTRVTREELTNAFRTNAGNELTARINNLFRVGQGGPTARVYSADGGSSDVRVRSVDEFIAALQAIHRDYGLTDSLTWGTINSRVETLRRWFVTPPSKRGATGGNEVLKQWKSEMLTLRNTWQRSDIEKSAKFLDREVPEGGAMMFDTMSRLEEFPGLLRRKPPEIPKTKQERVQELRAIGQGAGGGLEGWKQLLDRLGYED